jgi:ribose transport system substrate-binding protein
MGVHEMLKCLTLSTILMGAAIANGCAQTLPPLLDPDGEADRINWYDIESKFGPPPKLSSDTRLGGVVKTFVNKFWRATADGMEQGAKGLGVHIDVQAAQNENDQLGQLSIARSMLAKHYAALLLSPLSSSNLQPIFDESQGTNTLLLNVSDSLVPGTAHFVGNTQSEIGVRAAKYFISKNPDGGEFALLQGQAGSYASNERCGAFRKTLAQAGPNYKLVADVPANWDRELAYNTGRTILQQHPDLKGVYAANDGMALGVVEAVKSVGALGKVAVIGTDGETEALKSIKAGELTATIDSFPELNGQISVEVADRLLGGQKIPRVVSTGQTLITQENFDRYRGDGANQRAALLEDAGVK